MLPEWCRGGRCWNFTYYFDEFVMPMVKIDDGGTFTIVKLRSVKTCDAFISRECAEVGADAVVMCCVGGTVVC